MALPDSGGIWRQGIPWPSGSRNSWMSALHLPQLVLWGTVCSPVRGGDRVSAQGFYPCIFMVDLWNIICVCLLQRCVDKDVQWMVGNKLHCFTFSEIPKCLILVKFSQFRISALPAKEQTSWSPSRQDAGQQQDCGRGLEPALSAHLTLQDGLCALLCPSGWVSVTQPQEAPVAICFWRTGSQYTNPSFCNLWIWALLSRVLLREHQELKKKIKKKKVQGCCFLLWAAASLHVFFPSALSPLECRFKVLAWICKTADNS